MTEPIARFQIPLRCAPLQNVYARMHWSERAKLKGEALTRMLAQSGRAATPLEGRPVVRVTRRSSREPDADSGMGCKLALDCLKADRQGLGWIRDDSPDAIELEVRWEKAKNGEGSLIVEVQAAPRGRVIR